MSLTTNQMLTLATIQQGRVYQLKFGYGAWRIQGANPSTVGRLISLGLAKWGPFAEERIDCLLTEAGREELPGPPL